MTRPKNYLSLDDARMLQMLLKNPESNAYKLVSAIENRQLFKRGYEIEVTHIPDPILRMKTVSYTHLTLPTNREV